MTYYLVRMKTCSCPYTLAVHPSCPCPYLCPYPGPDLLEQVPVDSPMIFDFDHRHTDSRRRRRTSYHPFCCSCTANHISPRKVRQTRTRTRHKEEDHHHHHHLGDDSGPPVR